MTMVRFATTCDAPGCGQRSEEYTAWPSCEECLGDICPQHTAENRRDADVGQGATVLCVECAARPDAVL